MRIRCCQRPFKAKEVTSSQVCANENDTEIKKKEEDCFHMHNCNRADNMGVTVASNLCRHTPCWMPSAKSDQRLVSPETKVGPSPPGRGARVQTRRACRKEKRRLPGRGAHSAGRWLTLHSLWRGAGRVHSLRTPSGEVQVECSHSALDLERCRSSALLAHSFWRGAGQVHSLRTPSGEVQVECTPCALVLERCRSSALLAHSFWRGAGQVRSLHFLWRGAGPGSIPKFVTRFIATYPLLTGTRQ